MINKLKAWKKAKELDIVLKWCNEFQESNSNQREFKTFKIWAVANLLTTKRANENIILFSFINSFQHLPRRNNGLFRT